MAEVQAFFIADPNQIQKREPKAIWAVPTDRSVLVTKKPLSAWLPERPEFQQWQTDFEKCAEWIIDWDGEISSFHAKITAENGKLRVQRKTKADFPQEATNKIFFRGQVHDDFLVEEGESFWTGRTLFLFGQSPQDKNPTGSRTLRAEEFQRSIFSQSDRRLNALAALPQLIHSSLSDEDMEWQILAMLLEGIPSANQAAILELASPQGENEETYAVRVRRSRSRHTNEDELRYSRQLLLKAVQGRQNEYFSWDSLSHPDLLISSNPGSSKHIVGPPTVMAGVDWSICMALPDETAWRWALTVTGRKRMNTSDADIVNDQKFLSLITELFSTIRKQRQLVSRYSQLARMLPLPVLEQMVHTDLDKILEPRKCRVTVLYFDLRGSTRMIESGQEDLHKVMGEMNAMMEIMTSAVNHYQGAIGDFQGDAAIACWGWPLDQDDQIERATRAALAILRRFLHREAGSSNQRPRKLPCGIGLAHGELIAGRLGPAEQFKVALFGHAANLSARLQSMTKVFGAHVLIDEDIAKHLCRTQNPEWWRMPSPPSWCRIRPVTRVRPAGMDGSFMMSELLPLAPEPHPVISEVDRLNYSAFLNHFIQGEWQKKPPYSNEGPVQFLMSYIEQRKGKAPPDWDGIIDMSKLGG